jgi:hypothetical protein
VIGEMGLDPIKFCSVSFGREVGLMRSLVLISIVALCCVESGCGTPSFRPQSMLRFPPSEEIRRVTVNRLDKPQKEGEAPAAHSQAIENPETIEKIRTFLASHNEPAGTSWKALRVTEYRIDLERAEGEPYHCQVGDSWIRVNVGEKEYLLPINHWEMREFRRLLQSQLSP